jgi:hypothetical protein
MQGVPNPSHFLHDIFYTQALCMLYIALFDRSFRAYRGVTLNHAESGWLSRSAAY